MTLHDTMYLFLGRFACPLPTHDAVGKIVDGVSLTAQDLCGFLAASATATVERHGVFSAEDGICHCLEMLVGNVEVDASRDVFFGILAERTHIQALHIGVGHQAVERFH